MITETDSGFIPVSHAKIITNDTNYYKPNSGQGWHPFPGLRPLLMKFELSFFFRSYTKRVLEPSQTRLEFCVLRVEVTGNYS